MEYDFKKNYYQILNISKRAPKEQIQARIISEYEELNNGNNSQSYVIEKGKQLREIGNVLLNNKLREEYNAIMFPNENLQPKSNTQEPKFEQIYEEPAIKVVKKDEKANYSNKALIALGIAGILSLTTGVGLLTGTLNANNLIKNSKTQVINSAANYSNPNTTEEQSNTKVTANSTDTTDTIQEESAEEATTVILENNDSTEEVAKRVWDNVQKLQANDPSYAPEISEKNIINLVKWAKHDENNMTNANAWGQLMELAENPEFNLADITDGLDIDESMNKYIACFDGVSKNGTLVDENKCINDINNMSNELDKDSIVIANLVTAEMYAQRPQNQEIGLATNTIVGGTEKILNTISKEDIQNNNVYYTNFINSFNSALDASDQEDLTLKR